MIDLSKIKEDFSVLVKEAQPWTLTQFVMWLDLKLSEFKIKGYMVLDHNIKTKPKWLIEDNISGDITPSPAPCQNCNKPRREERQFYSDIHASPSELQYRTVTKNASDNSQQQLQDDTSIRGEVGIIDLSDGIAQRKNNNQTSGRTENIQVQSYRQLSSHDYHMGEKESNFQKSEKRPRPEVIEIDAPSPQEKRFISGSKSFQKTSTPVTSPRVLHKPKNRQSLSMGTAIYTSTSSTTTPTFSTSYSMSTQRSAQSNRNYALGAPPVTSNAFSTSTNLSDFQNLEKLIAQTSQYNESLTSHNILPSGVLEQPKGFGNSLGHRQPSQVSVAEPQNSFGQSTFSDINIQPTSFSDTVADQSHSQFTITTNQEQNLYNPQSEAVPVALHVINRENSVGSVPSTSDITEIKIESDSEDNVNDSVLTDASLASISQPSLMDTLPDSQQPLQSQSQSFAEEPGGLPKQGLVDPETAKAYQMVELVNGSGVYVFDKNIQQAFKVGAESQTGTYSGEKMARYLLNVFWSRKELVGATLSKAGRGKKILNQQIIEAILDFCEKYGRHSRSQCREASRNVVTSTTCKEKKKILRHRILIGQSISQFKDPNDT
ncbi:uncharacterized protein LOC127730008 isoform X5 [Mytilus californianus]|uniref:uncharacterized protein LOC127730008 isoform X5 n=1 Tax=Mytilus californianus TaxID=6549 RepID=UPI002246D3FA|nr:uncharacterized protein LOC127730008 isoform X5 [Mytilus californianus]